MVVVYSYNCGKIMKFVNVTFSECSVVSPCGYEIYLPCVGIAIHW